jgi:hypothetical protein
MTNILAQTLIFSTISMTSLCLLTHITPFHDEHMPPRRTPKTDTYTLLLATHPEIPVFEAKFALDELTSHAYVANSRRDVSGDG